MYVQINSCRFPYSHTSLPSTKLPTYIYIYIFIFIYLLQIKRHFKQLKTFLPECHQYVLHDSINLNVLILNNKLTVTSSVSFINVLNFLIINCLESTPLISSDSLIGNGPDLNISPSATQAYFTSCKSHFSESSSTKEI